MSSSIESAGGTTMTNRSPSHPQEETRKSRHSQEVIPSYIEIWHDTCLQVLRIPIKCKKALHVQNALGSFFYIVCRTTMCNFQITGSNEIFHSLSFYMKTILANQLKRFSDHFTKRGQHKKNSKHFNLPQSSVWKWRFLCSSYHSFLTSFWIKSTSAKACPIFYTRVHTHIQVVVGNKQAWERVGEYALKPIYI